MENFSELSPKIPSQCYASIEHVVEKLERVRRHWLLAPQDKVVPAMQWSKSQSGTVREERYAQRDTFESPQ